MYVDMFGIIYELIYVLWFVGVGFKGNGVVVFDKKVKVYGLF